MIPVNVTYDQGIVTHHTSLVHLWNDWYKDYVQMEEEHDSLSSFPFIVVRLEDLSFQAKQVTTEVCECAGGKIRTDQPFRYIVESAKDGPGHGNVHQRTGMLRAMTKYSTANNGDDGGGGGSPQQKAQAGFRSVKDYELAKHHLDPHLMKIFHYQHPPPSSS